MDIAQILGKAQEELNEALRLDQFKAASMARLADVMKQGELDGSGLQAAQDMVRDAAILEEQRHYRLRQAEQLCDQAFRLAPRNAVSLHLKGVVLAKLGREVESGAVFRQAVDLDPNSMDLHKLLIGSLLNQRRGDDALAAIERLLGHHPEEIWAVELQRALFLARGDQERAQESALHMRRIRAAQSLRLVQGDQAKAREAIALARAARTLRKRRDDQVVFVSERPRGREQKMSRALMRAGKEVVLLYRVEPHYPLDGSFSRVIRYDDPWDALRTAVSLVPQVFHVFSLSADETAIVFLRNKPGPVIFDTTDVWPNMIFGTVDPHILVWQTEMLADADALCCRDLQYRAAARKNGWTRHRRVIWYPEYVEAWRHPSPLPSDGWLRAASAGNIDLNGMNGFDVLVKALTDLRCRVDIFAHFFFHGRSPDEVVRAHAPFIEIGRETASVTVHPTLPPDRLVEELGGCDIGISATGNYLRGNDHMDPACQRACGSARETDYLEAGLVVLGDPPARLQKFIANRYAAWVDVDAIFAPNGRRVIEDAVASAKQRSKSTEGYTQSRNVPRLMRFYQQVSAAVAAETAA